MTPKHIRDHLRIITRRRCWALYGALWLALILMIVTNLLRGDRAMAIYALCLLVLTLLAFFAVPELQTVLRRRRWHYIAFRPIWTQAKFYEDRMVFSTEAEPQERSYPYHRLWRVFRSDDLLILAMKGHGEILLATDGFQKGDPAKFRDFLQRKAPKAKIRY